MLLDDSDNVQCNLCRTEFVPEKGGGQCPACGNPYDYYCSFDARYISWGDSKQDGPTEHEIVSDSKKEYCPECSREYKKILTNSERYFIIRKKCVCGIEDEEVIKK